MQVNLPSHSIPHTMVRPNRRLFPKLNTSWNKVSRPASCYYFLAISLILSMCSMSSILLVKTVVQEAHSFIAVDRHRTLSVKTQVRLAIVIPYVQRDSERWVGFHQFTMFASIIVYLHCMTIT